MDCAAVGMLKMLSPQVKIVSTMSAGRRASLYAWSLALFGRGQQPPDLERAEEVDLGELISATGEACASCDDDAVRRRSTRAAGEHWPVVVTAPDAAPLKSRNAVSCRTDRDMGKIRIHGDPAPRRNECEVFVAGLVELRCSCACVFTEPDAAA
jgi:hypothetical protein